MDRRSRLRRLAGVGTRFLIVGGISTLIEVGAFNLFVYAFGWDLVVAKVGASLVALINAYFGNREWAFRHRDRRGRVAEIVLFLGVNLVCTLLGAGLVWLGAEAVEVLTGHAPGPALVNIVNLGSIAVIVVVRFLLYHYVVFRHAPKAAPSDVSA
ncbi:Putative flippase GtrA (Transmembrane translocase of bactoprenol-linked glucose) [Microbacterium sp. 8M]|jgi:putative flippase GtrA|uniref:GtrA family protein n=1 Tax=Microbacterium sp. 8M TaxID=2653153 RepID=UPI0012F3F807|nr:GtrA family protein [Microbacterium sp. 8M]VXB72330.1 Putative flippase GtrA (Transmembrane translocase of bactoprenol-linked glucose) [Microbacterium sp. 8M]